MFHIYQEQFADLQEQYEKLLKHVRAHRNDLCPCEGEIDEATGNPFITTEQQAEALIGDLEETAERLEQFFTECKFELRELVGHRCWSLCIHQPDGRV